MLTEEEETQLVSAMLLVDVIEAGVTEATKTTELSEATQEIKDWIDGIWETLTEEEKNQALDRYKNDRNSGEIETLPPMP